MKNERNQNTLIEPVGRIYYTAILRDFAKQYNYSIEDTAKLQQLIDSGQFELAEQLQIGLIEQFNNKL